MIGLTYPVFRRLMTVLFNVSELDKYDAPSQNVRIWVGLKS